MEQIGSIEGYQRLAGAVVLNAVKDFKDRKYQEEVVRFIASQWFGDLAAIAGFSDQEVESLRQKIFNEDYEDRKFFAPYRKSTHTSLSQELGV